MPSTQPTENGPRRLGDFEIVRELGRGGMGVVFEARQISLNRQVALKVLASTLGLTARAVERFQREAEAAAKLHHTNIVPVYATGEQDGAHFYAMELIAGPSLDLVIKNFCAGDLTVTQLEEIAGNSNVNKCEGHYFIGMKLLSERDRHGAAEHFRKAVDTPFEYSHEYYFSQAFLSRLEKNPDWPPWIPKKDDKK
jgi:Protein kinase domain